MRYQNAFLDWLTIAIVTSGLCLLVYASVQQNYRQSLNDPQIQIAENVADLLSQGEAAGPLIPSGEVDLRNSLAPWVAIYDLKGKIVGSNGLLEKELPKVPAGVLEAAKDNGGKGAAQQYENRVTWQPQTGVRQALVVVYVPAKDMYVAVGRNMREVESRVDLLSTYVVLTWLGILVSTGLLKVIPVYISRL